MNRRTVLKSILTGIGAVLSTKLLGNGLAPVEKVNALKTPVNDSKEDLYPVCVSRVVFTGGLLNGLYCNLTQEEETQSVITRCLERYYLTNTFVCAPDGWVRVCYHESELPRIKDLCFLDLLPENNHLL